MHFMPDESYRDDSIISRKETCMVKMTSQGPLPWKNVRCTSLVVPRTTPMKLQKKK